MGEELFFNLLHLWCFHLLASFSDRRIHKRYMCEHQRHTTTPNTLNLPGEKVASLPVASYQQLPATRQYHTFLFTCFQINQKSSCTHAGGKRKSLHHKTNTIVLIYYPLHLETSNPVQLQGNRAELYIVACLLWNEEVKPISQAFLSFGYEYKLCDS